MNATHTKYFRSPTLRLGLNFALTFLLLAPPLWAADPKPKAAATKETAAPAEKQRLISLVVLLRAPRTVDEHALADAIAPALGLEGEATDLISAKPPYFQVKLASGPFIISNITEPYFKESAKMAASEKDPALRKAMQDHKAWLGIDWGKKEEPADVKQAYQLIGKMAAALAGEDALGIYSPETGEFAPLNDEAIAQLKSDDPLQVFAAPSTAGSPGEERSDVVTVDPNDPKLKAAQSEAKKRWREFVAAFNEKNGSEFSVKGRLVEGENAEYMWLKVSEIDGELVHGTLDNEPAELSGFKMGQDLHIKLAEVDDWVYIGRDKKPRGGFTIKALDQLAKTERK